jgi:hypothetical protein
MTAEEKAEIERLAVVMKNVTPGKIAARLQRHPATVKWYMLCNGLIERPALYATKPYMRGGKMIYPFSPEQDALIEQLRAQGKVHREIAEELTKRFGIKRTAHGVQVRLVQISAAPEQLQAAE